MTDKHSAYTSLLMRHRDMLWRLCLSRAKGDGDRSQDLLQEITIALWENYDKLRPDSSPGQERAWVRWQARSVFYQVERRRRIMTVPIDYNLHSDSVADEEAQQRKETLDNLLATLSPDEQRMMRLYLDGYQGDEIGEEMGISRNTVYQRMRRAVQKMRNVALVLLAMLLTTAIAVAVVPQWRQYIFHWWRVEETPSDSVPAPKVPEPSVAQPEPVQPTAAKKTSFAKPQPMEQLPSLSAIQTSQGIVSPDTLDPLQIDDMPTVSVNGSQLTITGASGEQVKVYDSGGMLIASQVATNICIIDLFPRTDAFSCRRRNMYILQIGNRPTLKLEL